MQQNISLVYDLLFLIVFAVVAVCSWHKGFLASLAELIGAVFGVGIAVWASQTAAPQIYEKFLSASVANRVELALRESNGNIAEALQGISFLPESMQQSLLNLLNDQLLIQYFFLSLEFPLPKVFPLIKKVHVHRLPISDSDCLTDWTTQLPVQKIPTWQSYRSKCLQIPWHLLHTTRWSASAYQRMPARLPCL